LEDDIGRFGDWCGKRIAEKSSCLPNFVRMESQNLPFIYPQLEEYTDKIRMQDIKINDPVALRETVGLMYILITIIGSC